MVRPELILDGFLYLYSHLVMFDLQYLRNLVSLNGGVSMRTNIWYSLLKRCIETNPSENVIFENYKYLGPGHVPK